MKFEKISKEEMEKFCNNNSSIKVEEVLYTDLPMPKRSTAHSSGYDFYLPIDCHVPPHQCVLIPTFMKAQLDCDKVLEMYPRSSYGIKKGLMLANTVGIIDADYYNNPDNEGHIMICLRNMGDTFVQLEKGDKFCQGIIKQFFLVEGDEYGVGEDRAGGIGSTGK